MRCKVRLGALLTALVASLASLASAQPMTCHALVGLGYTASQNFPKPGDILTVTLSLGSGSIFGGTTVDINRVRFELDCDADFPLGIPCTDDGRVVRYQGDHTITNTCTGTNGSVTFSTNVPHGGARINEIVFTPDSPIAIPTDIPEFCALSFDIKVRARSNDSTPDTIEQIAELSVPHQDAVYDNGLTAIAVQVAQVLLCPHCSKGCTCDQESGICVPRPHTSKEC